MGNDKKEQLDKQLKAVRLKKKLTQVQMAELLEMNDNYYARLERGEKTPSVATLRRITDKLHITIKL